MPAKLENSAVAMGLEKVNFLITKMGTIKDANSMDITEAEDIKKRWQEYTEKLYKKDLHDPGNHDGVIIHYSQTSWSVKSSGL